MRAGEGALGAGTEYERFGPFGSTGSDVGESAIHMLGELLMPKSDERTRRGEPVTLDEGDLWALDCLEQIDTGIRFIEPDPDVDGGDIGDLHRIFGRLYAALPFSEPERAWLWTKQWQEIADGLGGEAAEIMSGGVLRVLQGRDLVRRWWAWQRETEEFTGQGSLKEACCVLGELAETLVLEPNRPREWPTIRAQLDALSD